MEHTASSLRLLFIAAVEIPDSSARAAFLDVACQGETELRARIEQLLIADAQAGGFLRDHGGAALLALHLKDGQAGRRWQAM